VTVGRKSNGACPGQGMFFVVRALFFLELGSGGSGGLSRVVGTLFEGDLDGSIIMYCRTMASTFSPRVLRHTYAPSFCSRDLKQRDVTVLPMAIGRMRQVMAFVWYLT